MRKGRDPLPETKRRELARLVEILFAEFQDAMVLTTKHRWIGRILKEVLCGVAPPEWAFADGPRSDAKWL